MRALGATPAVDDAIGFHARQAVEKSLKAILVTAGVEIPYLHDLARLLALAGAAG